MVCAKGYVILLDEQKLNGEQKDLQNKRGLLGW